MAQKPALQVEMETVRDALMGEQTQYGGQAGIATDARTRTAGRRSTAQSLDAGAAVDQTLAAHALPATGLASLDVQFPSRGVEFLFTTPRGDIEIEAMAIDVFVLQRLIRLMWVVGLVIVVGVGYRTLRHHDLNDYIGRALATLLIIVGLFFITVGLLPLLAIAGIALGTVQHVRLSIGRRQRANH